MVILDVTPENVDELGFFCYMSKRKSEGYQRKLAWVKERFAEGLRIKLLKLPDRGFIEYIPGEYAWRAVDAPGWFVIHCLWVVGKSKKQGYAAALLEACLEDARASGANGVAVVTSEGNWLIGRKLFVKHGFETVDTADPSFTLLAKSFGDATPPRFSGDWSAKSVAHPDGLTVFRCDQCPYIPDAVTAATQAAEARAIPCHTVELQSAEQVRTESPSPFGVYGMTHEGCLLSYHYLLEKDFDKRLPRNQS